MDFALKYTSRFGALHGIQYRIEIFQKGYVGTAMEVTMGDVPVVIEWAETNKLDPVQSSCATIKLYSESDRQFVDLYTVEPGTIRLDVYRNNSLYWSGMLDPELYSEPYSYKKGYLVEFTFSDFAILDRVNWSRKGKLTIQEIIDID